MKKSAFVLAFAFLTGTAVAQLTPGEIVPRGDPFPIIADFNGDGFDDLVCEKKVILNHGGSFAEERTFPLADRERVMGVLDVNGDHIPDLYSGAPG